MPILKVAVTVEVQGISQAAGVVLRLRRPRAPAKQRKLKRFQAKTPSDAATAGELPPESG